VRSTLLTALTVLVIAAGCASPAAADVTGADIVGFLNAQRAANGLPAAIVEDPALSAGCWTTPGRLRAPGSWSASSNPFDESISPFVRPPGLEKLLAPRLDRMGAATKPSNVCAAVASSSSRPAPAADITYTYPVDGAQEWWTRHWTTVEGQPDESGQTHPETVAVGTVLHAFFDGPDLTPQATAEVTSATLTGPRGSVPVDAYGSPAPTRVTITPRDRLQQYTTYTATVSADVQPEGGGSARAFTRTWSFTTGGLENKVTILGASSAEDGGVWVSIDSVSHAATVAATGPGTPATAPIDFLIPSSPWSPAFGYVKLDRRGTWHVCARSGGPGTEYRVAEDCRDIVAGRDPAPPAPPPPPAPPRATPPLLSFPSAARARLTGRTLAIPVHCAAVCRLAVRGTIIAGPRRLALPPTSRHGNTKTTAIRVTLSRTLAARIRRAKVRKVALTIVARPAVGKGKMYRKTLAIR
jgi:hypothetical protein